MKRSGRTSSLRVFLALDPPVEVLADTEAWARHIARSTTGMRVVPARNAHVTLAFLGQRDQEEIDQVLAATEATINNDGEPRDVTGLALGAPAWLPKRRPRNLVIDLHDDRRELADLQTALAEQLNEELGWREGRPYRPHLTCARLGRGAVISHLNLPVSPALEFDADSVSLYISHLSPEGAEYEAIETFPLSADPFNPPGAAQ